MINDYVFLRSTFVTSEKRVIEMLSELLACRPTVKFGWIFCKSCAFHAVEWSWVSWKSVQEGCILLMAINEIAFTPVSWHAVRFSVNNSLLRSVCYIPGCSVRHLVCTGLFEMIVGVLTTCHSQYTWYRSICIFYLIEQHSKFLLHTLQMLYMCTLCDSTNINTIIQFVPNCL